MKQERKAPSPARRCATRKMLPCLDTLYPLQKTQKASEPQWKTRTNPLKYELGTRGGGVAAHSGRRPDTSAVLEEPL